MTDEEGKSKKAKESSVIFSLRELKRLSQDVHEPEAKPVPSGRMSQKAFDPDEEQSQELVTEALSSLRERVEVEQRRLEQARLRAEEDQRLRAELVQLQGEQRQLDLAAAKAEQDRQTVEHRVVRLEDELRPPPAPPPSFAEIEAETQPKGVVVKRGTLVLFGLLVLGAIVALAAVIATRKPVVRFVTKAGVAAAGPAVPAAFGPELSWLDVGDAARAPVRNDDDGNSRGKGRSTTTRTRGGAAAAAAAGGTRIVLPPRPGDGGFIY